MLKWLTVEFCQERNIEMREFIRARSSIGCVDGGPFTAQGRDRCLKVFLSV